MHRPAQIGSCSSDPCRAPLVDVSAAELIDELLGAYEDTRRLALEQGQTSEHRHAHPGYLRDLQRVGRGALASLAAPPVDPALGQTAERPGPGRPRPAQADGVGGPSSPAPNTVFWLKTSVNRKESACG
ncbi:MAG TPA: hypothetical protein VGL78_01375 [Solirubrobacteraceae bacterium]